MSIYFARYSTSQYVEAINSQAYIAFSEALLLRKMEWVEELDDGGRGTMIGTKGNTKFNVMN